MASLDAFTKDKFTLEDMLAGLDAGIRDWPRMHIDFHAERLRECLRIETNSSEPRVRPTVSMERSMAFEKLDGSIAQAAVGFGLAFRKV